MSFWEKFKAGFRRFMIGRNGADELSLALLIVALVFSLISGFFGSILFNLLSYVAYFFCLFRMFSRNVEKRRSENWKYVQLRLKVKTSISQWWIRLKNMRKYKYFKCPECNALLRLPRKVGEVTVTCGKCRHAFKKSA